MQTRGYFPILFLAVLGLPGLTPAVRADGEEPEGEDIPLVGRPPDLPFSDASGQFRAEARAEPTVLEAQTPLILTLTVRATGAVRRLPKRIDLRQLSAVAKDFYIEDLPDPAMPDPKTWQFAWRLKPRRADVTEIPSLPFVYYNPDILQESRRFQLQYT